MKAHRDNIANALQETGLLVSTRDSEKMLYGDSYYIMVMTPDFQSEVKIRVSGHSPENTGRLLNEIHAENMSVQAVVDAVTFELMRSKFFNRTNEPAPRQAALNTQSVQEGDEVIEEWVSKKGNKMFRVLRTFNNKKVTFTNKATGEIYRVFLVDENDNIVK
jgi:hypothetical protein